MEEVVRATEAAAGAAARRPRLVLASQSPRRRALLTMLGLEFSVRPADVTEVRGHGEAPDAYVLRLARDKAAAEAAAGEVVLAADTTVALLDETGDDGAPVVLEKPRHTADARRMLALLAGREHAVYTGVAVLRPGEDGATPRAAASVVETRVRIAELGDDEIRWYVDTGEPMDKAGAYGIQGVGAMFVEEVAGNYSNVVGLPLPAVYRLMADIGLDLRGYRESR